MKILRTRCAGIFLAIATSTTFNLAGANSTPIERQLALNGVTLPYTEVGEGDTVVSIHGAVSDMRVWHPYQEPLSKQHHFVSYTRRFYGLEPWPEGENVYDASVHADDLASLIRSLGTAPVHLLARSSGGYSAVITAVKHPELVRSLVLWEPFVGNDFIPSAGFDENSLKKAANWRKGFALAAKAVKSNESKKAVEHFIEHVYELGSGGFSKLPDALTGMFYDNARTLSLVFSGKTTDKVTCEFLGKIKAPTLVLRGGDTAEGYALAHIKAALCIPDSKLLVIDGVVHDGAGKKVSEISEIAVDFWGNLQ